MIDGNVVAQEFRKEKNKQVVMRKLFKQYETAKFKCAL